MGAAIRPGRATQLILDPRIRSDAKSSRRATLSAARNTRSGARSGQFSLLGCNIVAESRPHHGPASGTVLIGSEPSDMVTLRRAECPGRFGQRPVREG